MVKFKRQPGRPCCVGCDWLHVDYRNTPDPDPGSAYTGDARLQLTGGAAYDHATKRVQVPGGGALRSVTPSPSIENGIIAVRLHLDDLEVDEYGAFAENPVIRIFLESNDVLTDYQFVEVRKVLITYEKDFVSGTITDVPVLGWLVELGTRQSGVETIYHYGYAAVNNRASRSVGLYGGGDYWITLSRYTRFLGGYGTGILTVDTSTSPKLPSTAGSVGHLAGTALEMPLADPAGTHFGIRRMDVEASETPVSVVAVGTTTSDALSTVCVREWNIGHAPCFERAIRWVPLVNDTHSPDPERLSNAHVDYYGAENYSVDSAIVEFFDGTNNYSWDCGLEIYVEDGAGNVSTGQDPAVFVLHATVVESKDGLTTGTLEWYASVALADHAMLCDAFEVEFLKADSLSNSTNPAITLSKIKWSAQEP